MYSKQYIKGLLKTYTCDCKNNTKCNAKYCVCNGGTCARTTEYKHAKKNFINYIKRIINSIRGKV